MSDFQTAYLAMLALLTFPAWGRQRYAMAVLWVNLAATLAACLAMDLGGLDRTSATLTMMVIDFGSGVALAMRPGLPRLLAWFYAITVPVYSANVALGVPSDATWGIVYTIAVAQLGVLAGGSFGNPHGGGRRYLALFASMEAQGGNEALSRGAISSDTSGNRVQN